MPFIRLYIRPPALNHTIMTSLENPTPTLLEDKKRTKRVDLSRIDVTIPLEVTPEHIFEMIREIKDPEHPYSLEKLKVVRLEHIYISLSENEAVSSISVQFTPTIPHCSMATLIGLCIRIRLLQMLPSRTYIVDVSIRPGTHRTWAAINKQLSDKERVAAALENPHLIGIVNECLEGCNLDSNTMTDDGDYEDM